ncbi:putative membrane protein hemolysin III like protein [Enhygromyxa salina]|uniref:Putative membrane protein hemolysin III like protein n=1 Tax=Enhygromyxa salina TaxID=215803 RepID=A0A0C2CT10_9BACT|nr:hemolysin III family protein [Enhygromyxa salina]KIG14296.1 putative membrane protein hemolysin III like protein [Enhygromyxa salina]
MSASSAPPKPRLRGVSHQIAFFVFVAASAWLLSAVEGHAARRAVVVYGLSLALLYGVSATYHRRNWTPAGLRRMQRLDHSVIFVLIAGSYTPLFLLFDRQAFMLDPLLLVWALAAMGIGKSLVWAHGPTWVTAALAIAIGWSGLSYAAALIPATGSAAFVLFLATGVAYSTGGVIYARRRPDPIPTVFGYHEVFHVFVILGSSVHFTHTLVLLRRAGALG